MREPFFVVTTGRSGSVSLALTLSQHPLICALHEPHEILIRMAWQQLVAEANGKAMDGDLVTFFRTIIPRPAGVQMCGVVDQKLVPFIPYLAEAWPGSRFVWLVRDGQDVVASGVARGWYAERSAVSYQRSANPWERYRWRGDEVGGVREWAEMGPFERNCWYWWWVNQLISGQLSAVSEERWRMVRLEDVGDEKQGGSELELLQEWLGVEAAPMGLIHANAGPQAVVKLNKAAVWDEEQRALFDGWCGGMMAELGYG